MLVGDDLGRMAGSPTVGLLYAPRLLRILTTQTAGIGLFDAAGCARMPARWIAARRICCGPIRVARTGGERSGSELIDIKQ